MYFIKTGKENIVQEHYVLLVPQTLVDIKLISNYAISFATLDAHLNK
jgi:hypothetical protein